MPLEEINAFNGLDSRDSVNAPCGAVLSMREAVFMESPKMENLGSLVPTRPDTHGPVWMPMRMVTASPL